ncbi:MAG: tRNA threonylcarbamoyladenosine dehydratase [Ruminococcaceae bacterium]|nr:tRNA threonylcarbamoyladenosine dehydratase [Oscillospiraceae bacterium]
MNDQFSRSALLLGADAMKQLLNAKVALFGVGGVGGYCAEALARAGVGTIHLYDDDTISESNLNRQLVALHSTLGSGKAQTMAARIRDINPNCRVEAFPLFYLPQNSDSVDLSQYDYVADCIDTVTAKLELISRCKAQGLNVISALGTGNRMDPTAVICTDISKTRDCPLARVMRKELRHRGINHLEVICSTEQPLTPLQTAQAETPETDTRPGSTARRDTPGSLPFVPAAAGLAMASVIVRRLAELEA